MRKCLHVALLAGFGAIASTAHANETPADLTWYGITLYGIVDVGVSYQSHGSPLSGFYAQGLEYGISANSNHSYAGLAQNGLSQTRIGLNGAREFADGWSGIFTLETRFSPLSGEIANGPKSLTQNNGVPLASQTSNGDSSQAGQAFSSSAFAGVSSDTFGTLTLGRQYGLLYDNILKYDPNGGSYGFSLIGFSSVAAGAGNSEYNRLNSSMKYTNRFGPARIGAQYQPLSPETGGVAREFDLGADYRRLSVDATYVDKHVAVALGTYSPTASQLATLVSKGLSLEDSLKATLSNTKSWSLMARYDAGPFKAYAGYEHIAYANPDPGFSGLSVGSNTIGGYYIAAVTATAYTHQKILRAPWAGVKVPIASKLTLTAAFYQYDQNSYATGKTAGCSSPSASNCSGTENAYSLVLEYQFNAYADLYGGVLQSAVSGGLSSGFLNRSTTSTTAGVRLSF
jgi:predicted porin